MIKYIRLNIFANLRSISSNVVLAFSSIVFILFLVLQKHLYTSNFLLENKEYSWLFKMPIFMGSAIYITIISLFVFSSKRSFDELLIVKPITRKQMIFAKFVTVWFFILLQAFVWFFISILGSLVDKELDVEQRFKYAGSILYGSIVILLIVSSISIAVSQFLTTRSILAVISVISFALPFYSFVSETLIRDNFKPADEFFTKDAKGKVQSIYMDNTEVSEHEKSLWNKYNPSKNRTLDFFDIFNQFNYAYSVFYVDNFKDRNAYYEKDNTQVKQGKQTIQIGTKNYTVLLKDTKDETERQRVGYLLEGLITQEKKYIANNKLAQFNALDIQSQFAVVYNLIKSATLNLTVADKVNDAFDEMNAMSSNDKQLLFARKVNLETYDVFEEIFEGRLQRSTVALGNVHDYLNNTLFNSIKLVSSDETIKVFKQKKIINYYLVTFIWLSIALLIHLLSTWKYIKNTKFNFY